MKQANERLSGGEFRNVSRLIISCTRQFEEILSVFSEAIGMPTLLRVLVIQDTSVFFLTSMAMSRGEKR